MSIFPFIDSEDTTQPVTLEELPVLKEFDWDFDSDRIRVIDGNFVVVEGLDAAKVWIYKALKTPRYKFLIYTWDYGSELESLIGTQYTKDVVLSECKRYIEDCLLINPYITGVQNLNLTFDDGIIDGTVFVGTVYGEVEINV